MENKRNYAFDRVNYILIAVSMIIVIIGFVLMSGSGSDATTYDPAIFSARRIKVAPVVCFVGFVFMIYAIVRKPKDKSTGMEKTAGNSKTLDYEEKA